MTSVDPRNLPDMPELMIAGPGELCDDDLRALGHQVIAHYGDVWMEVHADVLRDLGTLLDAEDLPYLIPGTGTTCLDAAVANLFEPGQRVVVAETGFFGTRLKEIAEVHGLDVVDVPVEIGDAIDPQRITDALIGAQGIFTTHVETATGVRHPIDEIARVAQENDAIYVVDGIASVGGEIARVDSWGIDALVTGTQKGLEAPPGMGIIALGERGRERVEKRAGRPSSWYLDLKRWDWYRENWPWHPHPVTMPTNLVLALASSVKRILEIGLDSVVAHRAELAKRCREGLRNLGLEPVAAPGVEANLVVAMWSDRADEIAKHLLANEKIMVSGGLGPMAGKVIRVGLMGRSATEEMVDRVIAGAGAALGR